MLINKCLVLKTYYIPLKRKISFREIFFENVSWNLVCLWYILSFSLLYRWKGLSIPWFTFNTFLYVILSSNGDSVDCFFEDTFHGLVNEKYNYHILLDIFLRLYVFYILQFFCVLKKHLNKRFIFFVISILHLNEKALLLKAMNLSIQIFLGVSVLNSLTVFLLLNSLWFSPRFQQSDNCSRFFKSLIFFEFWYSIQNCHNPYIVIAFILIAYIVTHRLKGGYNLS